MPMPSAPHGPFQMPMFNNFVPRAVRPWIYVLLAFTFQFSGGVYLGSLNEMIGGMSLMREDILMCMYANLAGMAIYFPLLFRMKFCFTNKTLLISAALGIALCNMAATQVSSPPLLWILCFITGCCKIQGTFECMSNIQLWMTPKRDFTVFFPLLHIVILCSIQFSDLVTVSLAYYYHWYAMYLLVSGVMIADIVVLLVCTHHFRIMPKFPLFGIDWLGGFLWALLSLEITFIFNYGDWYDWLNSPVILTVMGTSIITAVIAVHRMFRIRHPYFEPKMWTYKNLVPVLILIGLVEAFLGTEHVLEEVFYEEGMKYSFLTKSVLDWWMLLGIVAGCLFSLLWMKVLRFNYYKLLSIGLASVAGYLAGFYFLVDTGINMEVLYLPTVLRGFGYAVLSATFMVCLEEIMSFQHFFQALSVFNMMHMILGGVIGCAIYATGLRYFITDNMARYSQHIDNVAFSRTLFDFGHFMENYAVSMEMMSVKQLYGFVLYACLVVLALLLLWDRPYVRSTLKRMPGWRSVGKRLKRSIGNAVAE